MRPNEGADEEIKDSSKFKVVWTPEVRFIAISSRLVRACAEPSSFSDLANSLPAARISAAEATASRSSASFRAARGVDLSRATRPRRLPPPSRAHPRDRDCD